MSLGISFNTPKLLCKSRVYRNCKRGIRNLQEKVYAKIPEREVRSEKRQKVIDWIGKNISSPENRLILGVSALMSQPFIDLSNKRIDEDMRQVSAARTVAKIIAGTFTGVIIRRACIKSIDTMCRTVAKEGKKLTKFNQLLIPKKIENLDFNGEQFKQYKNVLGTLVALFVMLFTNFLIDLPLTKWMTNKFVDKINAKKQKEVN